MEVYLVLNIEGEQSRKGRLNKERLQVLLAAMTIIAECKHGLS